MNILKNLYGRVRSFIRNQKLRYLPYRKIFFIWFKNRKLKYKIVSLNEVKMYKKSDTIFILGSGPSMNKLTEKQWQHISRHDSFGINFSFLLNFVPTFHSMEDGKNKWLRNFVEQRFKPYRKDFSKTIWFISEKHTSRFIHPRIIPDFFPEEPVGCFYKFPRAIGLNKNRPFTKEDFMNNSIVYRGSLTVALYLIDKIGYKNIVLLGVDLHTSKHFFDNLPEMQNYINKQKSIFGKKERKFEAMIPKGNKRNPINEYLHAANELYFKPKDVSLYIGNKDNLLYPNIKIYNWDS